MVVQLPGDLLGEVQTIDVDGQNVRLHTPVGTLFARMDELVWAAI